jgi:ankyrin repeat protein
MEVAMRVYVFAGLLAMSAPAFAGSDGLEQAILNGNVADAGEAIAAAAQVDAVLDGGVTPPLALAAARGDPEMVQALLALGASPDATSGLGGTG